MLSIGYRHAIRIIRRRKNLTQQACGERIGMDAKNWSGYETGANKITEQALERLRQGLQCTETELWNLALPFQRDYHHKSAGEISEDAAEYGTTRAAAAQVRRLLALDESALPPEDRHWFKAERDHLATLLTTALDMSDNMVEKYLDLLGKANRAQDEANDQALNAAE